MADRKLEWTPLFSRSYRKLDESIKEQVNQALRELATGQLSPGRQEKLRKPKKNGIWQIRVTRDFRLTYQKVVTSLRCLTSEAIGKLKSAIVELADTVLKGLGGHA